jgi:hypothetical protein
MRAGCSAQVSEIEVGWRWKQAVLCAQMHLKIVLSCICRRDLTGDAMAEMVAAWRIR